VCWSVTPCRRVSRYRPFVVTFCLLFQDRNWTSLKASQSYEASVWRLLQDLVMTGSPAHIHSGYMHDKRVGEDAAAGRRCVRFILFSFSTSVIWHRRSVKLRQSCSCACRGGTYRRGGMAPLTLDRGTRLRQMVSFALWTIYQWDHSVMYQSNKRLSEWGQRRCRCFGEEKNISPLPGIEAFSSVSSS
jgi:hypothetical protein